MSGGATSLEEVFQSFCAFGGGAYDEGCLMDGPRFMKFCRDMKLLDKKLTSTDVDIIYAQVKEKSARKINFLQFKDALQHLADKKYPSERDSLHVLTTKIMGGKGPSISGTTRTIKSDNVDRMTDASHYTGTHKERFDEGGKGRGMAGRDSTAKGRGSTPGLVGAQAGYVAGYKNEGTYQSPKQPKRASESVIDRLTDTSKYTGHHKHRFDNSGHGLGAAGRDLPAKGQGMSPGSVSGQAAYVHGYKHEGSYGKK